MSNFDAKLVGKYVEFEYPRHNIQGVKSPWRKRTVRVVRLSCQQAKESTIKDNPLVKRSEFSINGVDTEDGKRKTFYVDSMRNVREVEPPAESYEVAMCRKGSVEVVWTSDDKYAALAMADHLNDVTESLGTEAFVRVA